MGKKKISVTLESEQVREISELVGEEYESRSEAVRVLIDRGFQHDDLQNERDRLQGQLAVVNRRENEVTELVEYVEDEKLWRRQPLHKRLKWWLAGQPVDT